MHCRLVDRFASYFFSLDVISHLLDLKNELNKLLDIQVSEEIGATTT